MKALDFTGDSLRILDQTVLPHRETWVTCMTSDEVAEAIREMKVRGAPAIATAAVYGIVLDAQQLAPVTPPDVFLQALDATMNKLLATRPTAVNLANAIQTVRALLEATTLSTDRQDHAHLVEGLREFATAFAEADVDVNRRIGRLGAEHLKRHPSSSLRVLTHCNTGTLATVEYGTALGVIRALHEQGELEHVWVDETRPFLQGARLTAFELMHEGIPFTLITDSMAGHFMKEGQVDAVVVGADRITANGDTANKIGTYSLAVLCQYHKIPFYVAAPLTTFDLRTRAGDDIPIEQRDPDEVTQVMGVRIAPAGISAAHPAFDVTPHNLITAILTEHGPIEGPSEQRIRTFFQDHVTSDIDRFEIREGEQRHAR